jgi:hypothetical protein
MSDYVCCALNVRTLYVVSVTSWNRVAVGKPIVTSLVNDLILVYAEA